MPRPLTRLAVVGGPSKINKHLERLLDGLQRAQSTEDLAEIADQASAIDMLIRRRNLGLRAQQQAAILRIEAETAIGLILLDTERQGVGRPKIDSNGIDLPRRCDFGLMPHIVSRALRLANIPTWLKKKVIQDAVDLRREITMRWFLLQCESHLQRLKNLEPQPGGRVDDLYELVRVGRRFGTIYLDPPWEIPGTTLPYPTMTVQQIMDLPIHELAHPERCHLHLWTLPGRIDEIAYGLVRHWGFRPVSEFAWCKPDGLGSGQFHRAGHEVCLAAVLHDRDRFDDHALPSWGMFPRSRHSEKPDEVRKMIERASPGPRIELFARHEVPGWVTWGYGIARPAMQQYPQVISEPPRKPQYWRTPPEIYERLEREFNFDFDPCPYPLPDGFDGLQVPWGDSNYVNPPFHPEDGLHGKGPTAFVHKAIEEHRLYGKGSVLVLPTQSYVNMLLEAGAEPRPLGRVWWLGAETGEPCPSPSPITAFVLRQKKK